MVRVGGVSINTDPLAGTGTQKSILNKVTPPMATPATTLGDGAQVMTGRKTTEGYRRKTGVVM